MSEHKTTTIQVECKGGIILTCNIERLKQVSPYFSSLLSNRWIYGRTLKLNEVSSLFLIEQLEKLDENNHDPYEFLNIPQPEIQQQQQPLPSAPPIQPSTDAGQDGRVQLPINRQVPLITDVISHCVIHINRALFLKNYGDYLWAQEILAFIINGRRHPINFNEVWVMANLMAPQEIKFYEDRIDLPIFPDFVHFMGARYQSRCSWEIAVSRNVCDFIQVSAHETFLTQTLRNTLCYSRQRQIVPWTLPSDRGLTIYVSGDAAKIEEYCKLFNERYYSIYTMEYIQNDRLQNENPFGTNVRTLAIRKRSVKDSLEKLNGLFKPNTLKDVQLDIATANIEINKDLEMHVDDVKVRDAEPCVVWSLKDKRMVYYNDACSTMFV